MIYRHPITQELLKDVNDYAYAFHNEIIDPFEAKTNLKVSGWSNDGIAIDGIKSLLPIWFVLKALNDWK